MVLYLVTGMMCFSLVLLHRRDGIFSPFIWFALHMILYYAVAPFTNQMFYKYTPHTRTIILTTVIIGLTLLYYLIFNSFRLRFAFTKITTRLARYQETSEKKVGRRVFAGILLGFLLYVFGILVIYGGSVREVFAEPLKYRQVMGSGLNTLIYGLQYQLMYTLFFMHLAYRMSRRKSIYSPLTVAGMVFLLIISISLGSRGILMAVFLQILILNSIFKNTVRFWKILFMSAVLIFAFSIYLDYRNLGASDWMRMQNHTGMSSREEVAEKLDKIVKSIVWRADSLANLDLYLTNLADGDLHPHYFSSFSDGIVQYIPRNFYPDKPYYFSSEMTRKLLPEVFAGGATYDFTGIAEWIHNFSIWTIFLFPLMPALLLSLMQNSFKQGDPFVTYCLIYLPLSGLPVALINNGFLNTSNILLLPLAYFIYAGLFTCFVRFRSLAPGT